MIALLDRVILDVGPCLSWLGILLSSPFLPVRFLLRNPQIVLWELLCSDCLLFSCCFEGSLLKFNLGQCNYDVPSCVLPWVQLLGDSLGFLDFLEVYFLHQIGKFSFIICSNKSSISCCCSSPSGTTTIRILECFKLSQRFKSLSSLFWILISSFCSSWLFISYFCSKSLIWVPVSFPSLLVPWTFSFISFFIALIFFFA